MQIVIIGAGTVGFNIAQRLIAENKQVTVIDKDYDRLEHIKELLDIQTFHGSGSNPDVLKEAGVSDSDILLAVTDSDEVNLTACFFANMISPGITKLIRIKNDAYDTYREVLANPPFNIMLFINPEREIVNTIKRMIHYPGIEDMGEFANGKIKLVGVRVTSDSFLSGVQLKKMPAKLKNLHFNVGAIVRNKRFIVPTGDDSIEPEDLVYFVCDDQNLKKVLEMFGCHSEPIKRIMIIGGGDIGLSVALMLEKESIQIKIIEKDISKCNSLSEHLSKAIVLNGDGTDQNLLEQENISKMDLVMTLTGDEETNVLCSLLAKQLGLPRTITRITKPAYMPLVEAIGLGSIVSPRISAIDAILKFIRRGKVVSTFSFKGEEAEVLEAIVQEESYIIKDSLNKLPLLRGSVVLAIQRGNVIIIPDGLTKILPKDRIVILSTPKTVNRVENTLVKVEEQI